MSDDGPAPPLFSHRSHVIFSTGLTLLLCPSQLAPLSATHRNGGKIPTLGVSAMRPFNESMRQTIDWFRRQDDKVRADYESQVRRRKAEALAAAQDQLVALERARKGLEEMFGITRV